MKKKALMLITLILCFVVVLFFLNKRFRESVLETSVGQTKYSKEFSDKKFNQLTIGITKNETLSIIGEPLYIRNGDGWEVWFYSYAKEVVYPDPVQNISFSYRNVEFQNGIIYDIRKGFFFD